MMKKLLIVFGNSQNEALIKLLKSNLSLDYKLRPDSILEVKQKEHDKALIQVRAHIQISLMGEDLFVAYVGENLYMLKDNLPFDCVDLEIFFETQKKMLGGYDTPQQKEIVDKIIIGTLKEFQS